MGRHGESFYPNQSMNGLLHRLLFTGNNVRIRSPTASRPSTRWCSRARCSARSPSWPSRCSGRARRAPAAARSIWPRVLLAGVMASPIAWEHHYGVLAPIHALLASHALRGPASRGMGALLAFSYLLSADFLAVAQRLAATAWNPLQSYLDSAPSSPSGCSWRRARAIRERWGRRRSEPVDDPARGDLDRRPASTPARAESTGSCRGGAPGRMWRGIGRLACEASRSAPAEPDRRSGSSPFGGSSRNRLGCRGRIRPNRRPGRRLAAPRVAATLDEDHESARLRELLPPDVQTRRCHAPRRRSGTCRAGANPTADHRSQAERGPPRLATTALARSSRVAPWAIQIEAAKTSGS